MENVNIPIRYLAKVYEEMTIATFREVTHRTLGNEMKDYLIVSGVHPQYGLTFITQDLSGPSTAAMVVEDESAELCFDDDDDETGEKGKKFSDYGHRGGFAETYAKENDGIMEYLYNPMTMDAAFGKAAYFLALTRARMAGVVETPYATTCLDVPFDYPYHGPITGTDEDFASGKAFSVDAVLAHPAPIPWRFREGCHHHDEKPITAQTMELLKKNLKSRHERSLAEEARLEALYPEPTSPSFSEIAEAGGTSSSTLELDRTLNGLDGLTIEDA